MLGSQKIAMVRRWALMAAGRTSVAVPQGKGRLFQSNEVSGYYNDLTGKYLANPELDGAGIPLTTLGDRSTVRFPIAIFQYGLGAYDSFLETSSPHARTAFEVTARWAFENQRPDGSWNAFEPIHSKRFTVSAMAQGEGASLLIRAGLHANEQRYISAALDAIDFMLLDVSTGGTARRFEGRLILEEYPGPDPRTVLNGWIFAIFGLWDAALVNGRYFRVLSDALEGLVQSLSWFDMGYWSKYDISGRIASPAYHHLHIAQLLALYDLTGRWEFISTAQRYKCYADNRLFATRAIGAKVIQKLMSEQEGVILR